MKTFKLLYLAIAAVGLVLLSGTVYADADANAGQAHFGFVESIEDSQSDTNDYKVLRVSGKKYYFDWDTVQIVYKKIYVNVAVLEKGMKVKLFLSSQGTNTISKIIILSNHDDLLNH